MASTTFVTTSDRFPLALRTARLSMLERMGCMAAKPRSSNSVMGREKHLYSIYKKMKIQRKSFSEIMDVFGIRIIVDSVDSSYRCLDCTTEHVGTHGVHGGKAKVFELNAHLVHAQALGDRCVDIERFSGNATSFLWT
jgi:ppGpp synthetase/RelA/SpoT-type nucleotidyltranferase